MQLFEYVIIYTPKVEKDKKSSEKAKVLTGGVKTVLAANLQNAQTLVAREIPESFLDKLDEVQVAVRPF